jgi:membrane-associated protease RseP (regulator of RpoE activity)
LSNDYTPGLPPAGEPPAAPSYAYPSPPPVAGYPVRPRFQDKVWKHVVLLLLTVVTTTMVGAAYYLSFASNFGRRSVHIDPAMVRRGLPLQLQPEFLLHGLWYSLPVLLILGAHEMGHYLLCRRHKVDASLPYFIPAPVPLTGTLGAVIRIREAFPTRSILFDIGVAGPIAGFVVLVPVLFWGLALSEIVPAPRIVTGIAFGEPLLFKLASWMIFGTVGEGQALNAHPMVFSAWFGMFATALNLLPFGQLDGGHITYATLQHQSTKISLVTVVGAIVMCFVSTGWVAMTLIMLAMVFFLGARHPRVLDETEPLSRSRVWIAVFALVMLILCFTPIPIEPLEIIRGR